MAERASLKRSYSVVNQRGALLALLFCAACGGTQDNQTVETEKLTVPIIWQSSPHAEELVSMSIIDGPPVNIMQSTAEGLNIFDVDGVKRTEQPGPYTPAHLGTGTTVTVQGTELVIVPGTTLRNDGLAIFSFAEGLIAPVEIPLDAEISGEILGLCASASALDGGLLRLAYWTSLQPAVLRYGTVSLDGTDFVFDESSSETFDKYLTACALTGDATLAGGGFGLSLVKNSDDALVIDLPDVPEGVGLIPMNEGFLGVAKGSGGALYAVNEGGVFGEVIFRDALSVPAPERIGLVALSDSQAVGSLPNGFLAVESLTSVNPPQIIYVDANGIYNQLSAE